MIPLSGSCCAIAAAIATAIDDPRFELRARCTCYSIDSVRRPRFHLLSKAPYSHCSSCYFTNLILCAFMWVQFGLFDVPCTQCTHKHCSTTLCYVCDAMTHSAFRFCTRHGRSENRQTISNIVHRHDASIYIYYIYRLCAYIAYRLCGV